MPAAQASSANAASPSTSFETSELPGRPFGLGFTLTLASSCSAWKLIVCRSDKAVPPSGSGDLLAPYVAAAREIGWPISESLVTGAIEVRRRDPARELLEAEL